MYQPHLIAENLSYILTVWFFILVCLGPRRIAPSSFVLLVLWAFYSITSLLNSFDSFDYIQSKNILIMIDGATALILTMLLILDKVAWKQALILSFAVVCHIMVLLSLETQSAGFFYVWYDELIITVGLMQMGVSYNGFIESLGRMQRLVFWSVRNRNSSCKSVPVQKSRDKKT